MKRQHFAGLLLSTLVILGAGQAVALTSSGAPIAQEVRLRGAMPLTRVIYIDHQEHILSIVTNTDQNITPTVVYPNKSDLLPLSANVNDQYQAIVAANGGHLSGGTYSPVAPSYGGGAIKASLDL
ncbi:MAG TPA: hypothetical protein VG964_02385 [Candidatus Saccharimonadales bacterium]|nr:hypothetical protein [Candidatus Saccharimonadales bacterium]